MGDNIAIERKGKRMREEGSEKGGKSTGTLKRRAGARV